MQLPWELSERKYVIRRVWFSCYINDHEQGQLKHGKSLHALDLS